MKKKGEVPKDARVLFREHLKEKGIKKKWLADKANISPSHVSNIMAGRLALTWELHEKFNKALQTNY